MRTIAGIATFRNTLDMDICCRAISVGSVHMAYPMTVVIATGSAFRIEGTIVNDLIKPSSNNDIVKYLKAELQGQIEG